MPVLEPDFNPVFFMKNRHFSTILPNLFRRQDHVRYLRERLDLPDGDFIELDHSSVSSDRLVLLLHGLEGNSQRAYAKGMVHMMNAVGYDVCVFNQRGCSGTPNRLWTSYHSGKTDDLDLVLRHVISGKQYRSIDLAGVSLGGNIVLKYLGENAGSLPPILRSAVTVSVPSDLFDSAVEMKKLSNRIYLDRLLRSLKTKLLYKISVFPGKGISKRQVMDCSDFISYDDLYTAPAHGFLNAEDYYRRCSSKQYLADIPLPTLMLTAQNDPFFTASCIPFSEARSNSSLYLMAPEYGGHVGFMHGFSFSSPTWTEMMMALFIAEREKFQDLYCGSS